MNNQLVGAIILEATKLVGHFFRSKKILKSSSFELHADPAPHKVYYIEPEVELVGEITAISEASPPVVTTAIKEPETKATSIASGCVPCAIGHLGTCSGLLNEAMRFANKDGMTSPEVIDRVGMCLDELNAMERVDLRPEMVVNLPFYDSSFPSSEVSSAILAKSRS